MRLKLWGVRGSLPTPLLPSVVRQKIETAVLDFERQLSSPHKLSAQDFLASLPAHQISGFGGNTLCAEITHGSSRVLIDGGSGLRPFSTWLMANEPQTKDFHIYFTHFHWDHLIGVPFFPPMFMKGRSVHFYSVHDNLEESLRTLFRKPNFPVPYEVVKPQVHIHKIDPRKATQIGEIQVTPYQLDHPDPSWGARVEAGGRSLAWAVDTECTRISHESMGEDAKLYNDADLLVFDAQYTFGEALEKINWGHASGPIGIDLAMRERVKNVLFVHHDPAASDEMIRKAEEQTQAYQKEICRARRHAGLPIVDLSWRFAIEGDTVEV